MRKKACSGCKNGENRCFVGNKTVAGEHQRRRSEFILRTFDLDYTRISWIGVPAISLVRAPRISRAGGSDVDMLDRAIALSRLNSGT